MSKSGFRKCKPTAKCASYVLIVSQLQTYSPISCFMMPSPKSTLQTTFLLLPNFSLLGSFFATEAACSLSSASGSLVPSCSSCEHHPRMLHHSDSSNPSHGSSQVQFVVLDKTLGETASLAPPSDTRRPLLLPQWSGS